MLRDLDFDAIEKKIENAYRSGGYQLGWRMFSCTRSAVQNGRVAFVSMNPGGRIKPTNHPSLCVEHGNAYLDEQWDNHASGAAPLQQQVRLLFNRLRVPIGEIVSGHLVPFRSPDWASLNDKGYAISAGSQIWKDLMAVHPFDLVITMGGDVRDEMKKLLGARNGEKISVGWGNISGERAIFKGGVLVGLPHLSRFGLMGREQSEEGLRRLFEGFF